MKQEIIEVQVNQALDCGLTHDNLIAFVIGNLVIYYPSEFPTVEAAKLEWNKYYDSGSGPLWN